LSITLIITGMQSMTTKSRNSSQRATFRVESWPVTASSACSLISRPPLFSFWVVKVLSS